MRWIFPSCSVASLVVYITTLPFKVRNLNGLVSLRMQTLDLRLRQPGRSNRDQTRQPIVEQTDETAGRDGDPFCDYADLHGTASQRYYNVLCLALSDEHRAAVQAAMPTGHFAI
jgi:hypothetical protein